MSKDLVYCLIIIRFMLLKRNLSSLENHQANPALRDSLQNPDKGSLKMSKSSKTKTV